MKKFIGLILMLSGIVGAAITSVSKPYTIDTAATPRVRYIDSNDSTFQVKINEMIDTSNIYLNGAVIAPTIKSNGNIKLIIDADSNETGKRYIFANHLNDTLAQILDDSTFKAVKEVLTGNFTMSALLANRVPFTTTGGLFTQSANLTYDGTTLGVNNGTYSGTLGVTGVGTFTAAPVFSSGTASQTMELTAGKALTTVAITGTGNYVKSASPTMTGTITGASQTLAGTLGVTGVGTFSSQILGAATLRVTGANTSGFTGSGLEIDYGAVANTGRIFAYDRTGSAYQPLLFGPSLNITAAGAVTIGSSLGVTGTATLTGGAVVTATTDAASSLQVGGSYSSKVTAITGTTTLDATHNTIEGNATSASFTINLPAAAGCSGRRYAIHKNDASANTITVDGNAAEKIDGALTVVLGGNVGNSHLIIVSNGTNWRIEWLYEEGSFTGTLTGCTTSPLNTVKWTRVGNVITLMVDPVSATSNATGLTITGLPSILLPASAAMMNVSSLIDAGAVFYSGAEMTISAGTLIFQKNGVAGGFTNTATLKGLTNRAIFVYQL